MSGAKALGLGLKELVSCRGRTTPADCGYNDAAHPKVRQGARLKAPRTCGHAPRRVS